MKLNKKKKYLQISLNNDLFEAQEIIRNLPRSSNILVEAGTPLIMKYGANSLSSLVKRPPGGEIVIPVLPSDSKEMQSLVKLFLNSLFDFRPNFLSGSSYDEYTNFDYYFVADIKCADLADKEVKLAKEMGASAATCLGIAPIETIDNFIYRCQKLGLDSVVDMINIENPLFILRKLKTPPDMVILHRGVDESRDNSKQIPYYRIKEIKGNYDMLVAVAGVDDLAGLEEAFFNDANIVILWKAFFNYNKKGINLVKNILAKIQ